MEDMGGVIPSGADHGLPSDHVSRDFGAAKEGLREQAAVRDTSSTNSKKIIKDTIILNGN